MNAEDEQLLVKFVILAIFILIIAMVYYMQQIEFGLVPCRVIT